MTLADGTLILTDGILRLGADVFLRRDAANVLAQYNSTSAQAYRIYNTRTDASNYERLNFQWSSNVLELRSTAAGTGTVRAITITADQQVQNNTAGAAVSISAGKGKGTGAGGSFTIAGGAGEDVGAGATAGNGGALTISGGAGGQHGGGGGTAGTGGAVTISGGSGGNGGGAGAGAGGALTLKGGSPGFNGNGGALNLEGGGGSGLATTGTAGSVNITGGHGGNTTGTGGAVTITGGTSGTQAGNTASGGAVTITGGTPGTNGNGGGVTIIGGPAGTTAGNSGNVTLRTQAVVSGAVGTIVLQTNGANTRLTVSDSAIAAGTGVFIQGSVTAGITASTTQTQGQGALTSEINEVATCANVNDTVTLPTAVAGRRVTVINNGAQTLQIFPASGDNLGAGVDTATTLAAGSVVTYVAYNSTNWEAV